MKDLDMAPNILLTLHPEKAEAIFDLIKRWEYRRVPPARDPPMRLVLYATAPVQAAIGVAWSDKVLRLPVPELLDTTIASTSDDLADVQDYFEGKQTGAALRIDRAERFDQPIPRRTLVASGLEPHQNFRYINEVPADGTLPTHANV